MTLTFKIIKESLKILILASILSSIGGVSLQAIEKKLFLILPLLILLPGLNNMIGSFGTIMSSKFTTLLYLGKLNERWWKSKELMSTIWIIIITALISAIYIGLLSNLIAFWRGFSITPDLVVKVMFISLLATVLLVSLIICISIIAGFRVYKKNKDPDNFLIPITTSIADLGSMLIFSGLVYLLF
jgi:mgtE-like transporter